MSVVISYIDNDISIIATDTRVSSNNGSWNDNEIKLITLPYADFGWLAAVGPSLVIKTFYNYLEGIDIDDYLSLSNAYNNIISYFINESPECVDILNKFSLSYSWITKVENVFTTNIGILSNRYYGNNFGILKNGSISILYPPTYDSIELFNKFVTKYSLDKNYKYDGDLANISNHIASIFNEISHNCNTVSRILDIGICTISQDKYFKRKRRDSIENVIQELRDGTFISNLVFIE